MLLAIPYSTVASDHQFGSPGLRVLSEGRIAASTNSSAQTDLVRAVWHTRFAEMNSLRAPQSPKLPMAIRVALGGMTIVLGQAIETDLVQPISRIKTRAIGQASETDLAQSLPRVKNKILGVVSSVALAQSFGRQKTRTLGVVSEIDLSKSLGRTKSRVLGIAIETDLAQTITRGAGVAITRLRTLMGFGR